MKRIRRFCIVMLSIVVFLRCSEDDGVQEQAGENSESVYRVSSISYNGEERGNFGGYNEQSVVVIDHDQDGHIASITEEVTEEFCPVDGACDTAEVDQHTTSFRYENEQIVAVTLQVKELENTRQSISVSYEGDRGAYWQSTLTRVGLRKISMV